MIFPSADTDVLTWQHVPSFLHHRHREVPLEVFTKASTIHLHSSFLAQTTVTTGTTTTA